MKKLFIFFGLLLTFVLNGQPYPGIISSSQSIIIVGGVTSPWTKTWSTWTSAIAGENLADGGDTGFLTYSTGADASGKFVGNGTTTLNNEFATPVSNTETWETWGVPAGKVIDYVQLMSWKKKVVNATGLTSLQYYLTLVSNTTRITGSNMISTQVDACTVDGNYVDLPAGTQEAVSGGYQASNTPVKLRIYVQSYSATGSGQDFRFDDVAIKITFH